MCSLRKLAYSLLIFIFVIGCCGPAKAHIVYDVDEITARQVRIESEKETQQKLNRWANQRWLKKKLRKEFPKMYRLWYIDPTI